MNALETCLSCVDLTSLHTQDTQTIIKEFTEKVNGFHSIYPELPLPASICVYPNFGKVVRETLSEETAAKVHVTCVAGTFPTSQSWTDVKLLEARHAVEEGADEIDMVLAVGEFLEGNVQKAQEEIRSMRSTIDSTSAGKRILKVILETGALKTRENIAAASCLAMEAGADFIKTSTGKMEPSATPDAARIMCECIKEYYGKTGRMVGFKPAGGISTTEDALLYYGIVESVLGSKWLNKNYFRIGASRLANNLVSEIVGSKVSCF